MANLLNVLKVWGTPEFEAVFKAEVTKLEKHHLPLQAGLANSSHVSDSPFEPVILASGETAQSISVKTGIFYTGIIAGSCCADDPTPICEENEYCELLFHIDKDTGEVMITTLPEK